MSVGVLSLLVATAVLALGSVLQASTGMGTGILVVPLLALISLDLVPGPVITASLALTVPMTWYGRRHIAHRDLRPLLGGLLIGCVLGAYGMTSVPRDRLGVIFAVVILVAVAITSLGFRIPFTRRNLAAAGLLAGIMGSSSGAGAPPIALLYQHREGEELRPTLAFVYAASSLLILVLLRLTGQYGWHEVLLGLLLVPGYLLGYLIATPVARILDRGQARIAVLLISTLSAIILLVRSV